MPPGLRLTFDLILAATEKNLRMKLKSQSQSQRITKTLMSQRQMNFWRKITGTLQKRVLSTLSEITGLMPKASKVTRIQRNGTKLI